MRKSLASCVIVAVSLAAQLVHAEDVTQYPQCARGPSDTDLTAAKGAFDAGNASFDEADYPRAIVYWEDAYRRDCTAHALLLNLARAYELHGNKPQAVVALQTYLTRVPQGPDKDKIQRRIEVIQKQIDAEKAQVAATQVPAAVAPAPAPSAPPAGTAAPPAPDATGESPGKRPFAPLIVAGVGAGIAAVGTILYLVAKGDLSDADGKCPDRKMCDDPSAISDGNAARRRINVGGGLTVGGIVVVGGGLAWYFLSPRSAVATNSSRATQRLTPVATPRFLGVNYAGTF